MMRELMSYEVAGEPREWPEQRHRNRAMEMRAAIAAVLFEDVRNLDIRPLWTNGSTTYFRVNRWAAAGGRGPRISRSAFIAVTCETDGYRVREYRSRAAA